MIKVYIDVETTGLNEYKHGIHQLSVIVERGDAIVATMDEHMCPAEDKEFHEKAIAISEKSETEIKESTPQSIVFGKFIEMLNDYINPYDRDQKAFFIAYNSTFDEKFVRQWFYENDNKFFNSYFWNPTIDVMTISAFKLMTLRPNMSNFQLATVANVMNLEVDASKLHDSMYDIELTRQVYKQLK